MGNSAKRQQQQAALLAADPICKTSHQKQTDSSFHDTEREMAFTLQDLSDMIDTQGVLSVMTSMQLCFPTMYHEIAKYFAQQEKIRQKGVLQC